MHIIGKRVLKTSIAVALCLIIYLLLMILDDILGLDRSINEYAPTNWYTPFFATIATVYAMQNNPNGSMSQARIRGFGSIIGGLFGAVIIFIYETIYAKINGIEVIWTMMDDMKFKTLEFIVTTIGITILIPLTVLLKKKNAVFISCLTYLSVTISIRNGGMNVFLFAFNRILSTIIGVMISLYINTIPHFRKRNTNILFLSSLNKSSYNKEISFSDYSKYMINNLMYKKANFSFMTTSALSSLNKAFEGVTFKHKTILLNGICLYDPITNKFESLAHINNNERLELEKVFNKYNEDFFSYVINKGSLNCYYNKLENEGSINYFNNRIHSSNYAFDEAYPTENVFINQYVIIDKEDSIDKIINEIKDLKNIQFVKYKYDNLDNYFYLKINPANVSKLTAALKLKKETASDYMIVLAGGKTDIPLVKEADYSICMSDANDYVKNEVDHIMDTNSTDDLLRLINKIYNKKDYIKYLNKIRNK